MELRKHYWVTILALFFLGIILGRPEVIFYPNKSKCEILCDEINREYQMNFPE